MIVITLNSSETPFMKHPLNYQIAIRPSFASDSELNPSTPSLRRGGLWPQRDDHLIWRASHGALSKVTMYILRFSTSSHVSTAH